MPYLYENDAGHLSLSPVCLPLVLLEQGMTETYVDRDAASSSLKENDIMRVKPPRPPQPLQKPSPKPKPKNA